MTKGTNEARNEKEPKEPICMTLPAIFFYAQSFMSMALISTLFTLIVISTPKTMKNYGTLIFNALICDFIITAVDSLGVAEVLFAPIGFVVAFTGYCGYIDGFCYYCYCFIFLAYYQLVNINFFSYRSLISRPLSHRSLVIICVVLWITMISVTIAAFSFFSGKPEEVAQAIHEIYPNNTYVALHGLGAFGASAHTTARYRTLILLLGSLSSTTTSIAGIIFVRQLIDSVFRERESSLSPSTINLHKEMMKVFSLQTIVPLVLWMTSVGLNVNVYFFTSNVYGQNILGVLGFLPMFNTLVNIIFVLPYRRALLTRFGCFAKPMFIASTTNIH